MAAKNELTSDQIKIVYGNYGSSIKEIEILLLPKAKMILKVDSENNTVLMDVRDTDFYDTNLKGSLSYNTLDSLIRQLIKMRSQLVEDENETE